MTVEPPDVEKNLPNAYQPRMVSRAEFVAYTDIVSAFAASMSVARFVMLRDVGSLRTIAIIVAVALLAFAVLLLPARV